MKVDPRVEAKAREIWDRREAGFPSQTRMSWDRGTLFARMVTLAQAAKELEAENG